MKKELCKVQSWEIRLGNYVSYWVIHNRLNTSVNSQNKQEISLVVFSNQYLISVMRVCTLLALLLETSTEVLEVMISLKWGMIIKINSEEAPTTHTRKLRAQQQNLNFRKKTRIKVNKLIKNRQIAARILTLTVMTQKFKEKEKKRRRRRRRQQRRKKRKRRKFKKGKLQ